MNRTGQKSVDRMWSTFPRTKIYRTDLKKNYWKRYVIRSQYVSRYPARISNCVLSPCKRTEELADTLSCLPNFAFRLHIHNLCIFHTFSLYIICLIYGSLKFLIVCLSDLWTTNPLQFICHRSSDGVHRQVCLSYISNEPILMGRDGCKLHDQVLLSTIDDLNEHSPDTAWKWVLRDTPLWPNCDHTGWFVVIGSAIMLSLNQPFPSIHWWANFTLRKRTLKRFSQGLLRNALNGKL